MTYKPKKKYHLTDILCFIYNHLVNKLTKLTALIFIVCSFNPAAGESSKINSINFTDRIEEFSLDNGLDVIFIKDNRSDNVVSSIWYRVGSSYENEGITGISHLLEHMMFKGTEKFGAGEFSSAVKKIGGTENAFTGRDFTGYYQKVSKEFLSMCLKYEADRMINLQFTYDDLSSEREVVKEERRLRTEDQPISVIFEKIGLHIFGMTDYGIPIIGTMDDLNNITLSDLEDWYKKYYKPSNATLIISGNFDRESVKNDINLYFGGIKNIKTDSDEVPNEILETSFDKIRMTEKLPNPILILSYVKPKFTDLPVKDAYALELLLEIMDGGFSSRFTSNIIDKKIAISTFISHDLYSRKKSIISIGGIPRRDVSLENLKQSIINEFMNLYNEGLLTKELHHTKARIIASNIYKFDSIFSQTMSVGQLESKNLSWNLLDEYIKNVNAVTEQDIKEVAMKYIINNQVQISLVEPK